MFRSRSATSASRNSRRQLPTWKKLAFSLFVTVFFLVTIELGLMALGIKPRSLTEDPFVGFDHDSRLFLPRADGELLRTNPTKRAYFNEQQFSARKSPQTYRIFCLGGSTTFGHPYHDSTSFAGWLRARLRDADPQRDWQVINCGGISYASYRICHLMQELANYQPDLFIFYEGHNEFLEERTYGDVKQRGTLRLTADYVANRTRIGTSLDWLLRGNNRVQPANVLSSEVDTILDRSAGPERYHYDPKWTQGVVEHFRSSVDRACAIAQSSGAKIVFVNPASNLRDFSPFKSEHSDLDRDESAEWQRILDDARRLRDESNFAESAKLFVAAARMDPRHALTQWEAGDALFHAGKTVEAREYFFRAIDEDVCPLRATSTICRVLLEVAKKNNAPIVDFPKLIEDQLEPIAHHRIPGDESFLDHVHPTIEQNRRLAWALYDLLADLGVAPRQQSDASVIDRVSHAILDGIDKKQHALALVQVIQVLSWAGKNREALKLSDRAEETCANLSEVVSYRGRLLEKDGKHDEAFECFLEAVRRNPKDSLASFRLGSAYLRRQQFEFARTCFADSVRDTPVQAPNVFQYRLHMDYGNSFVGLRRWKDAAEQFRIALAISPGSPEAMNSLAEASKQAASDSRRR